MLNVRIKISHSDSAEPVTSNYAFTDGHREALGESFVTILKEQVARAYYQFKRKEKRNVNRPGADKVRAIGA